MNSSTRKESNEAEAGVLYIVATPIGNMEDITFRAVRILKEVDVVAAEDTRHTSKLLKHLDVKTSLLSYHEYNEEQRSQELIAKIREGRSIALVSDAGTPSVSDPGYRLVKRAVEQGIKVTPIPGVSAVVTALSVAGLPTDAFLFIGFPQKKAKRRKDQLMELSSLNASIIFYQSPRRILQFIEELIEVMGDREAVLAREMTKVYEEFIRGSLSQIAEKLREKNTIKGECTLIVGGAVGGAGEEELSVEALVEEIKTALSTSGKKPSALAKELAGKYALSRSEVYEQILLLKDQ